MVGDSADPRDGPVCCSVCTRTVQCGACHSKDSSIIDEEKPSCSSNTRKRKLPVRRAYEADLIPCLVTFEGLKISSSPLCLCLVPAERDDIRDVVVRHAENVKFISPCIQYLTG
uniref:Uncharacterized protein n=1 Tax=Branchiostoma floridae TaxID=7739 RepID=C3XWK1_BRAFL|eukprot:XP_002611725.1 hypothetical protein BRAFLDRAFT_63584 [Branchiostoma floridae]